MLYLSNPCAEDQQNFRTIPIYPTHEEFHADQRPFLRPNLTSQRYISTHIYLDTHFRLLREDFVRPLRDGIQQILMCQTNVGRGDQLLRTKRFDDIRVYFNTQVGWPTCTTTGINHTVKFDIEPLQVSVKTDDIVDILALYLMPVLEILLKIHYEFTFFCFSLCSGRTQRGWSSVHWSVCRVIILRPSCMPPSQIGIPNGWRRDRSRLNSLRKADWCWLDSRWGQHISCRIMHTAMLCGPDKACFKSCNMHYLRC